MSNFFYPLLYQINTRTYITNLSKVIGHKATLDDIPDQDLDELAMRGFDWVWFFGVWQTGTAGRKVSRSNPEWRREFLEVLPDLNENDITGSCYAITDYKVHQNLGGNSALARLRERLKARELKLMLDFVPNHTAPDHSWVKQYPDFFITGSEEDLAQAPANFIRMDTPHGEKILAYGRDPFFPGWPDTLQLNYSNPALQQVRIDELLKIASQCDGVRCDMAMLILPEVFERTWKLKAEPFWPKATLKVREKYPDFIFMAEVYWDLEWNLQQQGFDYCYDKRLYDRLREGHGRPVREHLWAGMDFQNRLARFLENHDEPRAAAVFPPDMEKAAAVVTFLAPGLRFFHQGQLEGYKKKIPVHLNRGPEEAMSSTIKEFYESLLICLKDNTVKEGEWHLLECAPAWDSNWTAEDFIAYWWAGPEGKHRLVVVNYGPHQSQCYIRFPFYELAGHMWNLDDLMGTAFYSREGNQLFNTGLYLDMPPWGFHIFAVEEQVQSIQPSEKVLVGSHA